LYDHHLDSESDIHASSVHLEAVGATTTLIVEALQKAQIKPNSMAATVMALGIHVDTRVP
jgi:tRNA nucleotidyltransferase (CCA-adding enzyme)